MKVIEKSNFRIVVEPETHIFGIELSDETVKRNLRNMEEQIKRHVDNIGYISIEFDKKELCSHCGLRWELSEDDTDPDFPKGSPVCCEKAMDEYLATKTQTP